MVSDTPLICLPRHRLELPPRRVDTVFLLLVSTHTLYSLGLLLSPCRTQPPVLDPTKSKVDGLAFLGLSLSRRSEQGHPDSITHQTAFDFNEVIDRDYTHIFSTNDDGWLVGGGEPVSKRNM